jgi:tetratricopeptide (TPR) repeat protein
MPRIVTLNNLAALYSTKRQYGKAEPLYERALAIREKALGLEHADLAASLDNLALLYDDQGQYAKAEPPYGRALAIFEKLLGPEHPNVAACLLNYAFLLRKMRRRKEAHVLKLEPMRFGLRTPDSRIAVQESRIDCARAVRRCHKLLAMRVSATDPLSYAPTLPDRTFWRPAQAPP